MDDIQSALESTRSPLSGFGHLIFIPESGVANYMKKQIFENIHRIHMFLRLVTTVLTNEIDVDTFMKELPEYDTLHASSDLLGKGDKQAFDLQLGTGQEGIDPSTVKRRVLDQLGSALARALCEDSNMEYHFTLPQPVSPARPMSSTENAQEFTTALKRPDSPSFKISVRWRSQNVLLALKAEIEGLRADFGTLVRSCERLQLVTYPQYLYTSKYMYQESFKSSVNRIQQIYI